LGKNIVDTFQNPLNLLNFLSEEKNRPMAEKLGLVPPQASPPNLTGVNGSVGTVAPDQVQEPVTGS